MTQNNELERIFFKLMNNSVLGKSIENMYKLHGNELDNTTKYRHESFSKPQFKNARFIDGRYMVELCIKNTTSQSMSDAVFIVLSKLTMMRIHYDVI